MGGAWSYSVIVTLIMFILDRSTELNKDVNRQLLATASLVVSLQGIWVFIVCVWTTKLRDVLLQRILPEKWSKKLAKTKTDANAMKMDATNFTFNV
jgi:hypothetical protein